jgi:hypothetical protein
MHLKFAKGAITTNLSTKKSIWGIKNAKFYADSKLKNVSEKVIRKNYAILVFRILHCFSYGAKQFGNDPFSWKLI